MKSRIVLSLLLLFFAANVANPQGNSKQPATREIVPPDVYELTGGSLRVTYTTTSKNGQPGFYYEDGSQKLSFKGSEIQQVKSVMGTLVTVRIRMTVDSGSTTFTLLVPDVRLEGYTPAQIHTIGITTEYRFSVIPAMNLGQKETYTTTELSGTANMVMF